MKTLHTIYTNFAKRLALVLTLLLTLGVISVWAETSTFTWGTNPSAYTSGSSNFSEGQVTFTGTKGTGSTPTRAWSDGLRMYAGGTAQFSVPDGYVITKIEGYTTFNFNDATGQQTVLFTELSKATCSTDVTVTYQSSGYTITYNTNGGTAVSSTTGTKLPNPLPTTTKTGYTFAGWFTNSELTTAATAGATINADITLYAKWTANKYTVKFNGNGNTGGSMTDQSFTYDVAQDLTANAFEKFGHTFAGWSKTSNGSVVYTDGQSVSNLTSTNNGTITLYAKWTEKAITNYRTSCSTETLLSVTYDANGATSGSVPVDNTEYKKDDQVTVLGNTGNLAKTGHTFNGWNTKADGTGTPYTAGATFTITENTTLYAQWTAYTVTWTISPTTGGSLSATSGNSTTVSPDAAYTYGTPAYTVTSGTATVSQNGNTFTAVPTANCTIQINMVEKPKWTVTFHAGEHGTCATASLTETTAGAGVKLPDVTPNDGYRFIGWATTSGATTANAGTAGETYKPESNITLYAVYKQLHTITWMVGSNSVHTEEVANNTGVTTTPGDPANDAIGNCANAFRGWSETPLGSAEGQSAPADLCTAAQMKANHTSVTGDKIFYAVFATAEETTGGTVEATLSFESTAQRTSWSEDQQVWTQNGVTLTNNRGSGSAIADNSNPARFYKNSEIIVTHTSNEITKIVFDCNSNEYATALTNSIRDVTVSTESDKVTVSFTEAVEAFAVTLSSAQVRLDAITVTAGGGTITTYSNYVTNCCALAPATNLTVSGTTAISATLTWTAPSPTTGITKLQVRDGSGNVVVDNLAANTTSATISGLKECTSYQYYVVSVGEDCEVVSDIVTAQPYGGAKTVNYEYNGGSGSVESFTTSCDDDKREIILPVATRPGYTFEGWYDPEGNKVGDAGATYDPATSPITLYAHWTENTYQLIHSGSNYTITENKTSIKSSDTPFTLHYTCTGDYGLPATISITGGGKSWTVGTDYTWEVAADKQSATLVIKETVISADVTITINVATRYTVTFVHNDKGVFSGSETIEVLSSENTITLPTVTDVSCGFYDTFEGWIVADEDYTESTSKPAGTIYKGGANYTVNSDCTLRALYSKCEGDNKEVYVKVIENLDDWSGTYLIVNETNNVVMDGSKTTETGLIAQNNCQNITINNNQIESNNQNDTYTFTIAPHTTTSGKYSIKSYSGYYIGSTSASNTINATTTESTYSNSITITDGILTIGCGKYKDSDASKEYRLMYMHSGSGAPVFKYYPNTQGQVCLYKKGTLCTKYYSTNPSCEKPVGVHIVYNANAVDASMSCSTQDRTYKVENEVNKYPQLASQLQFCTNATREGYTLVGWNTQANGQGTTYNINQNYYNLPVSGELDGDKWITLNLYAMWKPCIKFNLGNAIGGTGVPDAVVENGGCVLPTPTAEQLGTIPCGYEFYAWSETSVNATQTKPALFMPGDTYTGSALTLYAVYRLCETGSNADLFSLSYTISGTKYYVGPVLDTRENRSTKFSAVTNENDATVFGMKSVEGQTYKSLFWVDSEGNNKYMYWKDYGTSFQFTSEEDDSYGWTVTGTTKLTFVSTPYMTNGSRYLSADASEIGCPSEPKAVTQFTKEMASTMICTYATEPECSTTATLQFVTNGGTLNYPTTYDANSYQNLTPGTTVYLPTATFAGEWVFEGWMKDEPLTSQNLKPETVNFIEVELDITTYSASKTGTTTFYAVYSKTNDDKQFDPVNGGTYKLFAIGADGTKTYMPIWTGGRGTSSGVTTCAESGDYTITPGAGTHAGQYQITCGEYTLGVVSGNTDLNEVEGTWWNIEPSTSGKGTWRITVVGSTDDRALICSFSTAKSFGNYAISNLNNSSQTIYRDMEIGECIYTEYTSTPENIPYITITGTPVKITSTNGERVYAPTTLHIEAHNFTGERIIHLSATNGFGVDPVQVRTNGQGAYSGDVKVYYEPTTDGDGQTITTSIFTASQTGGTNDEKISQTFTAIQGRNMPANFVIAAKWDGLWYALPANCTTSDSSTEGLLIEVDDVDNPTKATSAPASAKYGIREVIPSRQTDNGKAIVFTERFAEGDKQFALYNGSDANIQVNAQYTNYAQNNPDKYEWIPSTSDFKDYTLTNASTGRNLGLTSGTFGAYTAASNQVRLLPATFYEPATTQVLKWKANSVIVMYTGPEATATTQIGDNAQSAEQILADQKLTHGIYELTTDQALTTNAGGKLSLYYGANTRVELEIPLIISGEVTAFANAHDVVILENSKLTAAATKYSYKDVYVYGGAKLAIPDGTELGVNNIILRAGGVATNGAGKEATYQYIYPQVELKGTLTSSVQNIRYEYVTDNDHWYHLVLPFDGSLTSIHYPYEYYGDQVKLDNNGSWIIKRYDGATRATGNYDAWKDIEKDEPKATTVTAGKGYIYWGAPKKITANGEYARPTWGIQRITMSVSAPDAMTAENGDKTISGLSSYKDVANNSGVVNDQGWNLIGNPYMVNLTTMSEDGLKAGKLEEEKVDGKWTGKWINNGDNLRYLTIPSEHFDTYEAKTVSEAISANALVSGRAFFVQLEGAANGITFAAANRASLMPALRAANDKPVDIETGIVLSNETLQDEVNFWIKAGKTNDYEYNADYPKTPNNNQFNIYGVHTNGDLSWVAISPEIAAESMPIGYQVPAAGTYMLSVSEEYYSDEVDALLVTDHEMSPEVTTDLMITSYEFSVNQAETNNKRFTVAIKLKNGDNNDATGLDNLGIGNENLIKFIYQDKIYILHHGVIYDATGKRVITINK